MSTGSVIVYEPCIVSSMSMLLGNVDEELLAASDCDWAAYPLMRLGETGRAAFNSELDVLAVPLDGKVLATKIPPSFLLPVPLLQVVCID